MVQLVSEPFARVQYRDAISLLKEEIAKDPSQWQYPDVEFGTDLQTEHERWLCEKKAGWGCGPRKGRGLVARV
jgi:asparaginyl-tRNA synthetase